MEAALTIVLPLLLVGVAFAAAVRFERRIPTRWRIYRFHTIAYPAVAILGLTAAALMRLSSDLDWWIDDATLYLALFFGISGTALCAVLAPVVWWWDRRPELTSASRTGRLAVSVLTLLPYALVAGIVLLYRE